MRKTFSNKSELLSAIHDERQTLEKKIAGFSPVEMVWPGAMGEWSVKDILAHLVDWEQRFIGWYEAGKRGESVQTPAPGMTWRDMSLLNQQGFEKHRYETLEKVLSDFDRSFSQILALLKTMTEDEIFTPGYYSWTNKSSLAGWISSNTDNHYLWASKVIKPKKIHQGVP
jgi:hypothetical protein